MHAVNNSWGADKTFRIENGTKAEESQMERQNQKPLQECIEKEIRTSRKCSEESDLKENVPTTKWMTKHNS